MLAGRAGPRFGLLPVFAAFGAVLSADHCRAGAGRRGGVGVRPGLVPLFLFHVIVGDRDANGRLVKTRVAPFHEESLEHLQPPRGVVSLRVNLGQSLVRPVVRPRLDVL